MSYIRLAVLIGIVLFLMVIAVHDYKTMKIPNKFIIILTLMAVMSGFVFQEISLMDRFWGIILLAVPMGFLAMKGTFGGGDVKLIAVTGFILGWKFNLFAFILASMIGGIYASFLLILRKKKRKDKFALGPFLCLGSIVSLIILYI